MTHSFGESYWEQVWRNGRAAAMSSAPTNPHLVQEVADLTPGTVLDAGCGGGAEAIWLAEHGWQVTAADVADAALAVAADRAAAKGVTERVRWVRADLSTWVPDADYDLVTTHYAHPAMPQLEFYDRLASWVTPGAQRRPARRGIGDRGGHHCSSGPGRVGDRDRPGDPPERARRRRPHHLAPRRRRAGEAPPLRPTSTLSGGRGARRPRAVRRSRRRGAR